MLQSAMMRNKVSDKIYWTTLILLAILALSIRILAFINIPDLYGDEASLAFNIFDKNPFEYFGALEYSQASPPIFLFLVKLCTFFIPNFEYSLRLIPFLASLFSIPAFYFLCIKFFKKRIPVITAFALFSFCPKIVLFSTVFKQYSSDVLIYVLILISYFYLDFNKKDWKFWVLILIYPLLIWVSYPAIFAFSGVFLLKLIKSKNLQNLLFAVPFTISFAFFYLLQHHLNSDEMLHSYWASGFINYNFSNIFDIFYSNLKWFLQSGFNTFLFAALFVFGFIFALRNIKNEKNMLILILLLVTLFLSYFHIYPLSQRTSLYILPLLILFCVLPFNYMSILCKKSKLKSLSIAVSVFFILSFVVFKIFEKPYIEHIETILLQAKYLMSNDSIKEAGKPTEVGERKILYIPEECQNTVKFYMRFKPEVYNFSTQGVDIYFESIGNKSEIGVDAYIKSFEGIVKTNFLPKDTIYYVFVHYPKKLDMLNALYLAVKEKSGFKIYTDNSNFDALIVFKP